jgi:hypothetical protein
VPTHEQEKENKTEEQTSQIHRNTTINAFEQIIHLSFSGKGMNGIHFPEKWEQQTIKLVSCVPMTFIKILLVTVSITCSLNSIYIFQLLLTPFIQA